ncbi:hypothetical protein RDI58_007504 [Solanum bulbocastanum]|uniref:Uncharacterized protein n=1 Tax=Solanum bulbocastanum TaxID=147425 RepID=A0AAN8YJA5_SOLBU
MIFLLLRRFHMSYELQSSGNVSKQHTLISIRSGRVLPVNSNQNGTSSSDKQPPNSDETPRRKTPPQPPEKQTKTATSKEEKPVSSSHLFRPHHPKNPFVSFPFFSEQQPPLQRTTTSDHWRTNTIPAKFDRQRATNETHFEFGRKTYLRINLIVITWMFIANIVLDG